MTTHGDASGSSNTSQEQESTTHWLCLRLFLEVYNTHTHAHTHTCYGWRLHSTNICLSLEKEERARSGAPEAHTAQARSLLPCPSTQPTHTVAHIRRHSLVSMKNTVTMKHKHNWDKDLVWSAYAALNLQCVWFISPPIKVACYLAKGVHTMLIRPSRPSCFLIKTEQGFVIPCL